MAVFTSSYTGQQMEDALKNAISLATTVTQVTIDSTTYNVLWEVTPTSGNDVYGLAVHPTDGKLYRIRNNHGTYSAQVYGAGGGVEASVDQNGTLNFTPIS